MGKESIQYDTWKRYLQNILSFELYPKKKNAEYNILFTINSFFIYLR